METITISTATYNNAKEYAKSQNLSVDEWIVKLLNSFLHDNSKKKRFKMLPVEELDPELQEIMKMPIVGSIGTDDINAEEERMSYYKEKYSLWKSAYGAGCDIIVTRNKKHFPQDVIQIVDSIEFFDNYWAEV